MQNKKIILVLTGEIASGKSKLAKLLSERHNFVVLKTREAIIELTKKKYGEERLLKDRSLLQKFGEDLDKKYHGDWVGTFFQEDIKKSDRVVIESARIEKQISALRRSYEHFVIHVHLHSSPNTLLKRFIEREQSENPRISLTEIKEKYDRYKSDATEAAVNNLNDKADLVVSTDGKSPDDVYIKVASFLKILSPINKQLVDVLVGAQYGSEGKGQVVGYLAPEYDCLVRVGGPNAGHQVYNEKDGVFDPDTFHIIPSGARRNPKAKIVIGPGAVISLKVLLNEISKFGIDSPERLVIDPNVTVISENDINIEKDINKIGGTGQGVGSATANNIIARLKEDKSHKVINCKQLLGYVKSTHEVLEKLFSEDRKILLEGTQGTFLSLHHGEFPYVTSRDTTASGCLAEAGIAINRVRKVILVTRTYPIRVQSPDGGTSGDFLNSELTWEEISKRSGIIIDELRNKEITSTTHRPRRVGEFSWIGLRKACELNSPTDIALTFVDYLNVKNRTARRYELLTPPTKQFIEEVERCSGVSVSLLSTRFDFRSIIDRRNLC